MWPGLQVEAKCIVNGNYAQLGTNNWPAQLQICGNPPGAGQCTGNPYNPNLGVYQPGGR